jgi:simple sugar transport system substrate-binding protein
MKYFRVPFFSIAFLVISAIVLASSCAGGSGSAGAIKSIAVFVPGAVAGSPIYEQLVAGAKRAADEAKAEFTVVEAGFDQSAWEAKLTELAVSGKYGLILTSNPAMPELCAKAAIAAPKQRFFVADGYLSGNKNISTALYNQVEQAYAVGYLAGLYLKANPKAGSAPMAGVVVAQRYPSFDRAILPGFEKGLAAAFPGATAELRVIGNWYDAQKAKELAASLIASGAGILFPIAGGAAQGVLSAAVEGKAKAVWFDSSAYGLSPGTIIGCAILRQEKLSYERVKAALAGKLAWGKAEVLGFKEGYVDFDDQDPLYASSLDEASRADQKITIDGLRSGKLALETPTF